MSCHKSIVFIFLLALAVSSVCGEYEKILKEFIENARSNIPNFPDIPAPNLSVPFDYVIIGGGTAGCVLASRLSENTSNTVLLLEAGGMENIFMDVPIFAEYLRLTPVTSIYKMESSNESCLAMNNNECNLPQGKVLGGSSSVNYMAYARGSRHDYDKWRELGNMEWSYDEVLPYFKKLERSEIPDADPPESPGRNGSLTISYLNYKTQIADAFVQASIQNGAQIVDYNGKSMIGVSHIQANVKNGFRDSTNSAYLSSLITNRPNLQISLWSHVDKIIIRNSSSSYIATHVEFSRFNESLKVQARQEIILSAGAIGSPHILMRSGVGPAEHLRESGIEPIVDLKVGYNFMDHIAGGPLFFTTNASTLTEDRVFTIENVLNYIKTGGSPFSTPGAESIAFYNLENSTSADRPNIELIQMGGSAPFKFRDSWNIRDEVYQSVLQPIQEIGEVFEVYPLLLRPKSRGRVFLNSSNPASQPIIQSKYLSDPQDVKTLIKGIRKALELVDMPAFKEIDAQSYDAVLPECKMHEFLSDEYWECHIRHFTLTMYHYAGTCKMGPDGDSDAVVDSRLKVRGVGNLRVADASVMPEIVSGHPLGAVVMIAERAADFIYFSDE